MTNLDQRRDELIALLREYQELCNRFEMAKAMAYFTEESVIKIDGKESKGMAEMVRIHDGDHGARLIVDFTDFELDGDTLGCFFHAESEADRVLGIRGVARWNRITFKENKILYWDIDQPSAEEIARRRPVVKAFWDWAEQKYPEMVTRARSGYNLETGALVTELARLWRLEHVPAESWTLNPL